MTKRILILGGTTDATVLAHQAATLPDTEIITSLAGRTRQPVLPAVLPAEQTRVGGFGGVAGLVDYLQTQRIDLLVDGTHPFAAQISINAAIATAILDLPRLMLIRPAWQPVAGDDWRLVESNAAAAALLPQLSQRIFLTIGRQELSTFAPLQSLWFLMRMIDPPAAGVPIPPGKLLLERGPFALEEERSLLQSYKIDTLVSKNSGGEATYAKIVAARECRIPVVMVQRPPAPAGEQAETVEAALAWMGQQIQSNSKE